jgi:predicted Na+-dependent transporter
MVVLPPAVEAALLVLAVSAGGILLPKRLMEISESSYVLSLTFVSSLMAIVMVPAWLTLLSPYFGGTTDLQPRDVALILTKAFLLPLLIGLFVRWRAPEIGKRLAERILEIGGLVLAISFVVLLAMLRGKLLEAGWFALLVLAGMAFIALAIGHWMGGPEPDNRTVLAVCCATRHVGIAVIVAAALPGPGTAALIGAYLLASMAVSVPYLQWRKRSAAARNT